MTNNVAYSSIFHRGSWWFWAQFLCLHVCALRQLDMRIGWSQHRMSAHRLYRENIILNNVIFEVKFIISLIFYFGSKLYLSSIGSLGISVRRENWLYLCNWRRHRWFSCFCYDLFQTTWTRMMSLSLMLDDCPLSFENRLSYFKVFFIDIKTRDFFNFKILRGFFFQWSFLYHRRGLLRSLNRSAMLSYWLT